MSDIELIIKIPNRIYKTIQNRHLNIIDKEIIEDAIRNSTPLPKGHGRLGDLDALEKDMINGIKAGNYEDGYDNYSHINNIDDCVECVKYADTIIEADEESEESE